MAKAIKKQVLGRGLAALLQDSKTDQSKEKGLTKSPQVGTIVELELGLIELNPFQPRTSFNEESLREREKGSQPNIWFIWEAAKI